MPDHNKHSKIEHLENSEVEITAEISVDVFESHRSKAVEKVSSTLELPGFRKGHVPEAMVIQKVGEEIILQEMAELAISSEYPKCIQEHNLHVIGRPAITITKIAPGNPLEFKAKVSILPEFELPDYKNIAKEVASKKEEVVVGDKEIEDTLTEIRKQWVSQQSKGDSNDDDSQKDDSKKELPELTDEFVSKLGDFKTVEDLKRKIKEGLVQEKEVRLREKKRMEIVEAIIGKIDINPPRELIEGELSRMLAEFKGNIKAMGVETEDYFKKLGKTEDDMKKEWEKDATKRVKMHLVFHKIAEVEKISASEEEIENHVNVLMERHKDADRERARNYVAGVLVHEKIFEFLEKQGLQNDDNNDKGDDNKNKGAEEDV